MAVITPVPGVVSAMLHWPCATVAEQLSSPRAAVTRPVGSPAPGALATTVKATVTSWPTTEGSGAADVIVVVVVALVTVCTGSRDRSRGLVRCVAGVAGADGVISHREGGRGNRCPTLHELHGQPVGQLVDLELDVAGRRT